MPRKILPTRLKSASASPSLLTPDISTGLVLKVSIIKGRDLAAKDRNGTSDPYVVLALGESRFSTHALPKTLNPEWNVDCEFPITSKKSLHLSATCWDKDRFGKDYMGEIDIRLAELFANHGHKAVLEPEWYPLHSKKSGRKSSVVSGEIQLQISLCDVQNPHGDDQQIFEKFNSLARSTPVVASRAASPVRSPRSSPSSSDEFSDDEESSATAAPASTSGAVVSANTGTSSQITSPTSASERSDRRRLRIRGSRRKKRGKAYEFAHSGSDVAGIVFLEIQRITDLPPESNLTRTSFDMDPFVVASLGKRTYRTKRVRHNLNPIFNEKMVFQVLGHELNYSFSFTVIDHDKYSGNDFIASASFPLKDLIAHAPKAAPETGLYPLSEYSMEEGGNGSATNNSSLKESPAPSKLKRLTISKSSSTHSLSKLIRGSSFTAPSSTTTGASKPSSATASTTTSPLATPMNQSSSTLSSPTTAATSTLPTPATTAIAGTAFLTPETAMESGAGGVAPKPEIVTTVEGHHNALAEDEDSTDFRAYTIPLKMKNFEKWEAKHNPVLFVRAKYMPYTALRQQFWRAMLRQYDADESGMISKIELTTMLDTLGSTLRASTIQSFFERFPAPDGNTDGTHELTIDQAVVCLEEQLAKKSKKQLPTVSSIGDKVKKALEEHVDDAKTALGTSSHGASASSSSSSSPTTQQNTTSTSTFAGASTSSISVSTKSEENPPKTPPVTTPTIIVGSDTTSGSKLTTIPSETQLQDPPPVVRQDSSPESTSSSSFSSSSSSPDASDDDMEGDELGSEDAEMLEENKKEEHVVEIRQCPICHQPRLNKRTDTDIITHIATCASQDWRQVNHLVMGGFVTSSQAQRKWYSKVITKVSYGGYKLGANSANILVQDRLTGQINEEKMSVYVRLGIRLLYKGLKTNNMEDKRIRKLLKSLSIKQGRKYDDPASKDEIKPFIEFHQLDMSEVLRPVEAFENFNEFFYRELKPNARPCSAPNNPKIAVSPADCRAVVYNRIDRATSIWVKGREFSIERLIGEAYPEDVHRYGKGSALGVFRLAPQDYHRFHIPVDGRMGKPVTIAGEYYTVNPMAIRSALDVFGENVRIVIPIDSPAFGRVMVICVGAMMVGSTVITRAEGEEVLRAEELGYFKFGGSTVLVLFEDGKLTFDDDLADNSSTALETLVRAGMSIGHSPDEPQYKADSLPSTTEKVLGVSKADKADAKRRIQGNVLDSA